MYHLIKRLPSGVNSKDATVMRNEQCEKIKKDEFLRKLHSDA